MCEHCCNTIFMWCALVACEHCCIMMLMWCVLAVCEQLIPILLLLSSIVEGEKEGEKKWEVWGEEASRSGKQREEGDCNIMLSIVPVCVCVLACLLVCVCSRVSLSVVMCVRARVCACVRACVVQGLASKGR